MKRTGQILRECREKKGITPSEVALATKIGVKIIEAIERGDLHSLPSKAFLRGFIRSYASFLKLDSQEIMDGFLEEVGSKNQANSPDAPATPNETPKAPTPLPLENKNQKTIVQIAIAIGVLVIILVVKFLFNTLEKYEHDAKPPTPAEIANTIKNDSLPPEPKPEPVAVEAPVATPPPAAVVAPAPAAPTPKPTPVTPPPVVTTPTPGEPKKALSTETGASIQSKELIVEALDAVEISYSADGGQTKKIKLEPDQIQIIKAAKNIKLEVSDGGAIDIIFNGEDQGVPGKLGKPMQLSYP